MRARNTGDKSTENTSDMKTMSKSTGDTNDMSTENTNDMSTGDTNDMSTENTNDLDLIVAACKSLVLLHGVGFASSTFVLSRYSEKIPLMTDEALRWSKGLSAETKIKTYSENDFRLLYNQLEKKVVELKEIEKEKRWDIRSAQETIWAEAKLEKKQNSSSDKSSSNAKKRKINNA